MKKKLMGLTITFLTSISLIGCDNSNNNEGGIKFHTGYEDLVIESMKPGANGKIKEPEITQAGYTVYGYYLDELFVKPFDFDSDASNVSDIYLKVLKGSGTQESPYLIESGLSLTSLTHFGEELSSYVKLEKDIEVLSYYTEDYEKTVFNGNFEGNNHKITLKAEGNDTGLFYKVGEEGIVKDLTLVGNIKGSHASTGAIANTNYGTISNIKTIGTEYHASNGCSNGVSLMSEFDEDNETVLKDFGTLGQLATLSKGGAGAISGTNYGTIKNCQNRMRVSATIGAGSMAGINYGTIESCYNQGAIGASGNNAVNSTSIRDHTYSFSYIGGMAGANYGKIHQCANLNQVFVARLPWLFNENPVGQSDFSDRIRVGGIAGYNYGTYNKDEGKYEGGSITECVNYGRVHGDMQVGGIAGYSSGYIADCFFAGFIGGRNSVGGICGWQSGDKEGDRPGLVTNCVSISRVEEGKASTVYDENENSFVTTKLTNKGDSDSNIIDYFKTAKYASNCVYHNNSGNLNPIDYEALINEEEETNTSAATKAIIESKSYDLVGYKNEVETGLWTFENSNETTAIAGINRSYQVFLNLRLAWQNKTITAKMDSGDVVINGIAGVDYINTIIEKNAEDKYISSWDANVTGAIKDKGLPTVSCKENEKVIWVTTKDDPATEWDGLLKDNITVYPMVVSK